MQCPTAGQRKARHVLREARSEEVVVVVIAPGSRVEGEPELPGVLPADRRRGEILFDTQDAVALRVLHQPSPQPAPPAPAAADRIIQALADAQQPLSRRALRAACSMRASSVGELLTALTAEGRVVDTGAGYKLGR